MSNNDKPFDPLAYFHTGISPYTPLTISIVSDREDVTPARYQEIIETDRDSIVSARIKPPVLGVDEGFGSIEVQYRTPRLISK